jgi:hypothetical protein
MFKPMLVSFVVLVVSAASGQVSSDWVQLTPKAAFSPRDTAEPAIFKGRYWLSNGYYHGNVLHRDLWSSSDAVEWTQASEATPYDGYSELVVYKGKLWAIKGSVWSSPDGETWTKVLAETPFGTRGYGEVVVFKDAIWQLGSGEDVWRSTDGKHWERVLEKAPFGKRSAAAVAVFQNKLWLMGGKTLGANDPPEEGYEDTTTYNDVWSSKDGKTWTRVVEHGPWSPRQWFSTAAYRDRLWVIGGYDNVNNTNLGDVWYSEDGKTWQRFESDTPFAPRHEPTVYVHQDRLLVVAGNTWPVVNDVWALDLPEAWTGQ